MTALVRADADRATARTERAPRVAEDRLELLTALVTGPRFAPLFCGEVLRFPPDHPTYRWRCLVPECQRACTYAYSNDLCYPHVKQWVTVRAAGTSLPEFLLSTQPMPALNTAGQVVCRICPQRPATSSTPGLCTRHLQRWKYAHARDRSVVLERWCADEVAFPGAWSPDARTRRPHRWDCAGGMT